MAERQTTLTMTPSEEAALARLIGFMCRKENERGELSKILGAGSADVDRIGNINAALNGHR